MKKLWVIVMLAVVACACVKQDDVRVSGVEEVKLRGMSMAQAGVDLSLKVSNASGRKISVIDADFTILKNGNKLMNVVLTEKVSLLRRSDGVVVLPLNVRFWGVLGGLGAMSALSKGVDGVTISGEATVKAGWVKKKISFENMPADVLLKQGGINIQDVLANMNNLF